MDPHESLGEIAYNAYCEDRGWKAYNGSDLPTYEEMKDDPKRSDLVPSWEAAGEAVKQHVLSEKEKT